MADKLFDRTVFNPLERPLSTDQNQLQSQLSAGQFAILERMMMPRAAGSLSMGGSAVFHGSSFGAAAISGMTIALVDGVGIIRDPTLLGGIGGIGGLNDITQCYPAYLAAAQTFAVPTADATNPRIDIIEVRLDRRLENPLTRDVFDPALEVFNPTLLNKSLTYDLYGRTSINGSAALNYKTGTPAGSPSAPSVTAGYHKIAGVYVGAGVTSIRQRDIADWRRIAGQPVFSARVQIHNDVVTSPKLTVSQVVCTPGFNVTLVTANAAPAVVGQSAAFGIYVAHPAMQGCTIDISSMSNNPSSCVGTVTPVGTGNASSAFLDILDGTTAGYTVWSVSSPAAPYIGLGQEYYLANAALLTTGGAAFGAISDLTLTVRAMST